MANFAELIRYGFPGYLVVAAAVASLMTTGTVKLEFDGSSSTPEILASLLVLAIGPFVGYLVHQVYFFAFDTFESYDKTRRSCVKAISRLCESEVPGGSDLSEAERERLAYASWKFVMTNMMPDEATISEVFLRRLSSLHEYQHAFGAILLSSGIAAIAVFPAVRSSATPWSLDVAVYMSLAFTIAMFWVKRREVSARADLFERVAVIQHKAAFQEFMTLILLRNSGVAVIDAWLPSTSSSGGGTGP